MNTGMNGKEMPAARQRPNPPVNPDRLQAALAGTLRGFAAPAAGYLARWNE